MNHCLLTYSLGLASPTVNLDPPRSITSEENVLQANLTETIPQLRFFLPNYVQVCVQLIKPKQNSSQAEKLFQ